MLFFIDFSLKKPQYLVPSDVNTHFVAFTLQKGPPFKGNNVPGGTQMPAKKKAKKKKR